MDFFYYTLMISCSDIDLNYLRSRASIFYYDEYNNVILTRCAFNKEAIEAVPPFIGSLMIKKHAFSRRRLVSATRRYLGGNKSWLTYCYGWKNAFAIQNQCVQDGIPVINLPPFQVQIMPLDTEAPETAVNSYASELTRYGELERENQLNRVAEKKLQNL